MQHFLKNHWRGSSANTECTLHQLSPYVGKMKSSMARALVQSFTSPGDTILDPFCGSGTIALEGWIAGRNVEAFDLSPYALTLSKAKLNPILSLDEALKEIDCLSKIVVKRAHKVDLRKCPTWVRKFYHPRTLQETISWFHALNETSSFFLQACLLGILHHQRPGFLSYPASHAIPYLRTRNFPRDDFPEMYAYRSVRNRLENKVKRVLNRIPSLDLSIKRKCSMKDSTKARVRANVIITSPPYMRQLDYARDNRLRLWFLGVNDSAKLDEKITPREDEFLKMMKKCLCRWGDVLLPGGLCVLVVGDTSKRSKSRSIPVLVEQIAVQDLGQYTRVLSLTEQIPNDRRVRRHTMGSKTETLLVLQKRG
jgi:DNA modification methylase